LSIKWDAFIVEGETRETREKIRAILACQRKE